MMQRNLNEERHDRKNSYNKRKFVEQLRQHHEYCESQVLSQTAEWDERKPSVATFEMQKH